MRRKTDCDCWQCMVWKKPPTFAQMFEAIVLFFTIIIVLTAFWKNQ